MPIDMNVRQLQNNFEHYFILSYKYNFRVKIKNKLN